jgi:hypothetical protein
MNLKKLNPKNWSWWKSRQFKIVLLSIVILLVAFELIARFAIGLGDIPVYIEHPKYEYIYAPNQDVKRLGNRIVTNKHSMRSKPLKKTDKVRVLKIGDSVLNGGVHVDHDALSSSKLEKKVQKKHGKNVRVLNISAGSWGPDNAFAYIKEHGHFKASMMVLVFSSHDLFDKMHFQKVVGKHPAWPDSKPWLASTDAFSRVIWPKVKSWFVEPENEYAYLIGTDVSTNNPGWESFFEYAKANNIELLVYLHPTQAERKKGEYIKYGRILKNKFRLAGINCVFGLDHKMDASHYRDDIHLNEKGHKKLAEILYPAVNGHIKQALTQGKTAS